MYLQNKVRWCVTEKIKLSVSTCLAIYCEDASQFLPEQHSRMVLQSERCWGAQCTEMLPASV